MHHGRVAGSVVRDQERVQTEDAAGGFRTRRRRAREGGDRRSGPVPRRPVDGLLRDPDGNRRVLRQGDRARGEGPRLPREHRGRRGPGSEIGRHGGSREAIPLRSRHQTPGDAPVRLPDRHLRRGRADGHRALPRPRDAGPDGGRRRGGGGEGGGTVPPGSRVRRLRARQPRVRDLQRHGKVLRRRSGKARRRPVPRARARRRLGRSRSGFRKVEGGDVGLPPKAARQGRSRGGGCRHRRRHRGPSRLPVQHRVAAPPFEGRRRSRRREPRFGSVVDDPRIVEELLLGRRLPRDDGEGAPDPRRRRFDRSRRDRCLERSLDHREQRPEGVPNRRQPRGLPRQLEGDRRVRRAIARVRRRPRHGLLRREGDGPGRQPSRVARPALPHPHHRSRVPHTVPRSDGRPPPIGPEAAQLVRPAGGRSKGLAAAVLQAGEGGVQGEDRRGPRRSGGAPRAVPLDRDPSRTPDRERLPVLPPPVLHHRVVPEGRRGVHPPDRRRHEGGATERHVLRGGLLDAHRRRSQHEPPGLRPTVDLPASSRPDDAGADDRAGNGNRPHAGHPAGPQAPVRTGGWRDDRPAVQRAVLRVQVGGEGLHLPRRARGLQRRGHPGAAPRGLLAKGPHRKGLRSAPPEAKRRRHLPVPRGGSLRVRLRRHQDGSRRPGDDEGDTGVGGIHDEGGGRGVRLRPLQQGTIRPGAVVVREIKLFSRKRARKRMRSRRSFDRSTEGKKRAVSPDKLL
mmetsp:Transcript_25890/g.60750  ORF Transcript_25890/g.60750 Transcript_25890/m.60750 type:complete len:735 (-) Transcript_25890:20-2224(-)